jgi:hypothetical protein
MGFFSIVLILVLVYFLIIKPLARRRTYDNGGYGPQGYGYGGGYDDGRGNGWGMAAGGFAAGALLTYLLEQGRIDQNQYDYYNSLGDQQMMDELTQENIVQQQEIDDLQNRMGDGGYDNGYDNNDNYDNNGYDDSYDDSYDDGGGSWDGGNDGSGGGDWM